MPEAEHEGPKTESLALEQEIRMLLNIVINYILLNIEDDPSLGSEVTNEQCGIEDMCFKAIKFSLEIPTVPIRKFLLLFFIYLRLLFGEAPSKVFCSEYV